MPTPMPMSMARCPYKDFQMAASLDLTVSYGKEGAYCRKENIV